MELQKYEQEYLILRPTPQSARFFLKNGDFPLEKTGENRPVW